MKANIITILILGDVVGRPGRTALRNLLPGLREKNQVDLVLVNGENAAGGLGLDQKSSEEIFAAGADLISLGDHTYQRKEVRQVFDAHPERVIRPINYPKGAPGSGLALRSVGGLQIAFINVMGRVFMGGALDCPFRAMDSVLATVPAGSFIIVDHHAEATSEKVAMGRHLDGKVGVVVGTHTHVQTADEQILPLGTAYITDLGMCGPTESVIGMRIETALGRFITGLPAPYEVGEGPGILQGVLVTVDRASRRPLGIQRVREIEQIAAP